MRPTWLLLALSSVILAQGWGIREARRPWLQGRFLQGEQKIIQMREATGDHDQIVAWEAELEIERARFGPAQALLRRAREISASNDDESIQARSALLYLSAGRYSDARNAIFKGHPWDGADIRKLKVTTRTGLMVISELYLAQGRYAEAIPILEKTRDRAKNISSLFGWEWSRAENDLSLAYLNLGRPNEAARLAESTLAAVEGEWGAESIPAMDLRDTLGLIRLAESKFAEADALLSRSRGWREAVYGSLHPKVAASYSHAALLSAAQGQKADGLRVMTKSLEIEQQLAVGELNGRFALLLLTGGEVFSRLGAASNAREYYQTAIPVLERELGADAPRVQDARRRLHDLPQQ